MADHIPTVRQRRLAQALRELRHDAGMTQNAVAARMGWHYFQAVPAGERAEPARRLARRPRADGPVRGTEPAP